MTIDEQLRIFPQVKLRDMRNWSQLSTIEQKERDGWSHDDWNRHTNEWIAEHRAGRQNG